MHSRLHTCVCQGTQPRDGSQAHSPMPPPSHLRARCRLLPQGQAAGLPCRAAAVWPRPTDTATPHWPPPAAAALRCHPSWRRRRRCYCRCYCCCWAGATGMHNIPLGAPASSAMHGVGGCAKHISTRAPTCRGGGVSHEQRQQVPAGPAHLEARELPRAGVPQVALGAERRLLRPPQAHHSVRRACRQGARTVPWPWQEAQPGEQRGCKQRLQPQQAAAGEAARCRHPPEATMEPSGDHATLMTESACPWNAATCTAAAYSIERAMLGLRGELQQQHRHAAGRLATGAPGCSGRLPQCRPAAAATLQQSSRLQQGISA